MTHRLRVLTFNCWMNPIGELNGPRLDEIAKRLATKTWDIVCLQEMFADVAVDALRKALCPAMYLHSFTFGGTRPRSQLRLVLTVACCSQ